MQSDQGLRLTWAPLATLLAAGFLLCVVLLLVVDLDCEGLEVWVRDDVEVELDWLVLCNITQYHNVTLYMYIYITKQKQCNHKI